MEPSLPDKPASAELEKLARGLELLVFDVDGVLTDGGLYYGREGEALKRFDVRDGHGMVMARMAGLKVAVLTARRSGMVELRGRELGLAAVAQGKKDKRAGLEELLGKLGVSPERSGYMGDDLNDLAPMSLVGLPACPADACPEVRQEALFISRRAGGQGAARDFIELVLKASGRWNNAVSAMRAGGVFT